VRECCGQQGPIGAAIRSGGAGSPGAQARLRTALAFVAGVSAPHPAPECEPAERDAECDADAVNGHVRQLGGADRHERLVYLIRSCVAAANRERPAPRPPLQEFAAAPVRCSPEQHPKCRVEGKMSHDVISFERNGHDGVGLRLGGQEEDERHPGEGRPPERQPDARAGRDLPSGPRALWRTVFRGYVGHTHEDT